MPGITFNFFDISDFANTRELWVKKLIQLAAVNKRIFLLGSDAQVPGNSICEFRDLYPDRFIDVGIAEANLVGIAAGLALDGNIPFAQAFGPFLSLRATDQIHTDVAYNDVPVRLIGTHGGLTSGGGPTHNTLLDFAIMRGIPNMTMEAPADTNQCLKLIEASLTYPGPIYIRIPRGAEPLVYANQDYDFAIGRAVVAKEGSDATLIAAGSAVFNSLKAAQELEKEGINIRVLDMHTIKPLDDEAVLKAARETGIIVTVEDHNVLGGLGSAVSKAVLESGASCKFKGMGIPDAFAAFGEPKELYAYYGYDSEGIKKQIKSML